MLVMAALSVALWADPEPGVKIQARGTWRFASKNSPNGVVLREPMELTSLFPYVAMSRDPSFTAKEASREMAADLKVKEIDWGKQMVILVMPGAQPSGGYRVEVASASVEKGVMTVKWKLHKPKGAAPAAESYPSEAILVPKHAGKVVFDPPIKK
jgi:hypothetical protein